MKVIIKPRENDSCRETKWTFLSKQTYILKFVKVAAFGCPVVPEV